MHSYIPGEGRFSVLVILLCASAAGEWKGGLWREGSREGAGSLLRGRMALLGA